MGVRALDVGTYSACFKLGGVERVNADMCLIQGFLRFESWLRAYTATAAFLDAKLTRRSSL